MVKERLLTLKEACRKLGVHPNALRKWDREGEVRVVGNVGGGGRIPESEVERLRGIVNKKVAIYCRVSSKQKGDLERQKQSLLEYAKSKGYEVMAVLEDIASGLDEDRKSLSPST